MARVTVVNDNPDFLEMMHDIFEDDRYDATTIDGDRPDALDAITASRPDLLIIDVRLGVEGDHGWQIAQQVRRSAAAARLPILLCGPDPGALAALEPELERARDVETLPKPFSVDQLMERVDRLLGEPATR